MVICFQCSKETKAQLEELMRIGAYGDYSEAIALAIANQVLLQKNTSGNALIVDHEDRVGESPLSQEPAPASIKPNVDLSMRQVGKRRIDLSQYGIPQIFKEGPTRATGVIARALSSPELSGH